MTEKVAGDGAQFASSLVSTLHDINGSQTSLLLQVLPILKENYRQAFISITPTTESNKEAIKALTDEPFFILNFNEAGSIVKDHYISGYKNAVQHSESSQILHLCDLDRLAYALLGGHRKDFLEDTTNISTIDTPLLYLRSEVAWKIYPQNYYAIESMVTELARILFGSTLDYTWCHLAITASNLQDKLPEIQDQSLVYPHTELTFLLRDTLKTKVVDWLSWEDPFNLGKNSEQLKKQRENDPLEFEKRMGYILPEINYLLRKFREGR